MPYLDYTMDRLTGQFDFKFMDVPDLFKMVRKLDPSARLANLLKDYLPLALANANEKAASEFLIAPVLLEARSRLGRRTSLFSGSNFDVDSELGLEGTCDFLLSRSAMQLFLEPPVVVIVEAVSDDLDAGPPSCLAGMIAAAIFNDRGKSPTPMIYGAVTSGTTWRFLLADSYNFIILDGTDYYIDEDLSKILGIIQFMLEGKHEGELVTGGPAGDDP